MASEKLGSSKGRAWFCTIGLPSDVVIQVAGMSFHLHKFPLMSKSRKLTQLILELEQNPSTARGGRIEAGGNQGQEIAAAAVAEESEEDNGDEDKEEGIHHISLRGFPSGAEAFESAAKFCYGVRVELTASNVAPLRCAAEYLDMADSEVSDDNLISITERFFAQSVLPNLKDTIHTLKSCEDLMPLAESIGIVGRCIESIASSDLSSIFGWPVKEGIGSRRRHDAISWSDELSILSLPIYKRVIAAMRAAELSSEVIEGSLISYANRSIPGLSRSRRKHSVASSSETEQRELLETIITNLPPATRGSGPTTTKFLFRLLRTVHILRASEESRSTLERKIGSQMEQATVDDLLMPSYSELVDTLYDVESAERILDCFLKGLEVESESEGVGRLVAVGKLMDGYLAEIASDANLSSDKFCAIALALPDHARVFDDGLYRAIDVYLKGHPDMREEERERVYNTMSCRKLTVEACTHAAQNERLPMRMVVQVLFFEQMQLRQAIAGEDDPPDDDTMRSAARNSQVMRLDMDTMRSRVQDLERECVTMRKEIQKIDRVVPTGGSRGEGTGWGSFQRRFGCKFKPQVCNSHQRAVVESRRRLPADHSP